MANYRVTTVRIRREHPAYASLDLMALDARKLQNSLNYDYRQALFNDEWIPPESDIRSKRAQGCPLYHALPSKVAREVSRTVRHSWNSFFALRRNGHHSAQPPGYLKGHRRATLHFAKDALSRKELRQGWIKVTGVGYALCKTPTAARRVKEVRVVPHGKEFNVEIVWKARPDSETKSDGVVAGLDLGVNNFAVVAGDNAGIAPLIVDGRYAKSLNQWANKQSAELVSKLTNDQRTSRRVDAVWAKRNRQMKAIIHHGTRQIVQWCENNNVKELVVGWSPGFKTTPKSVKTMGPVNNQNFRSLPMRVFIDTLKYKLARKGITVTETEESYTSKTSVLDGERPVKHDEYAGRRQKRGLFRSGYGTKINADVNGAAQTTRKVHPKAFTWSEGIAGKAELFRPTKVVYSRRLPCVPTESVGTNQLALQSA